ncbi:MAG: VIT1/CCC1 transporter family protein, partial [Anaerolineae bacterium]
MSPLRQWLQQLREYEDIAEIGDIARRYFAMNAFDGVLTMIGVLIGNYSAGVESARVVISTGLATSMAIGVSGFWGAYFTESAERKRDLDDLESHTLTDLNETKIGRASRAAAIVVSLVDGLAPFLAALVVLLPFFFTSLWGEIHHSYYLSLAMALGTLFALGAFLGAISRENIALTGVKMIGAGLLAMVLGYL